MTQVPEENDEEEGKQPNERAGGRFRRDQKRNCNERQRDHRRGERVRPRRPQRPDNPPRRRNQRPRPNYGRQYEPSIEDYINNSHFKGSGNSA